MTLLLILVLVCIVVLLMLVALNLRRLQDLVDQQAGRIDMLERHIAEADGGGKSAEPTSVFALGGQRAPFPPTEFMAEHREAPSMPEEPLAPPDEADPAASGDDDDLPLLNEPVPPSGAELTSAVNELRAQGLDARDIAQRLGVSEAEIDLVERLRQDVTR